MRRSVQVLGRASSLLRRTGPSSSSEGQSGLQNLLKEKTGTDSAARGAVASTSKVKVNLEKLAKLSQQPGSSDTYEGSEKRINEEDLYSAAADEAFFSRQSYFQTPVNTPHPSSRPCVPISSTGNEDWFSFPRRKLSQNLFGGAIAVHPVIVRDTIHRLPTQPLPMVAFAGYSNVGKSTLLNALVHAREIARPSHVPGRTRHLFIFDIGERFSLVDLPGYGFAKVQRDRRESWLELQREFVERAGSLRKIVILVDASKGIERCEQTYLELLHEACQYRLQNVGELGLPSLKKLSKEEKRRIIVPEVVIVLTKVDQLPASALHEAVEAAKARVLAWQSQFPAMRVWPFIHAVSAQEGLGLKELRAGLIDMVTDDSNILGLKKML